MFFPLDPAFRPAGVAFTTDSHIIFRRRTLAGSARDRVIYGPFRVLAANEGSRPSVSEKTAHPPLTFAATALSGKGITADATLKTGISNVEIAKGLPGA